MIDPADAAFPVEQKEHEAQVAGLLRLLGSSPRRVVDIGAGAGRIADPLAGAGHDVLAIDHDEHALELCDDPVETRSIDVLDPEVDLAHPRGDADAIVCLGHTLTLFHEPMQALGLMQRLRRTVDPEGWLAVDDFPGDVWSDVAAGNWQEGVAEDGSMQMVWSPGDNVIALRVGDAVDTEQWSVREDDVPMRLWSLGELRLLAHASGWHAPVREEGHLLLFRPIAPA